MDEKTGNGIDWENMPEGATFYAVFSNGWFEHGFSFLDDDTVVSEEEEGSHCYDVESENLTLFPQVVFSRMVEAINDFAREKKLPNRVKIIGGSE